MRPMVRRGWLPSGLRGGGARPTWVESAQVRRHTPGASSSRPCRQGRRLEAEVNATTEEALQRGHGGGARERNSRAGSDRFWVAARTATRGGGRGSSGWRLGCTGLGPGRLVGYDSGRSSWPAAGAIRRRGADGTKVRGGGAGCRSGAREELGCKGGVGG
ncbi:hypothetical protein D1007_10854 [Hordeum vulgare]|nr:hypothetical protein D1007_10854 [Hordeum vulgare]